LVESRRGHGGGLNLGKPPESIRVGDVVRIMEQSMELIDCNAKGGCSFMPICRLKDVFANAVDAFVDSLNNHTLADLIVDGKPL
jgi:Rrf2 family nitric oxide-sensitive transcriptional repressor